MQRNYQLSDFSFLSLSVDLVRVLTLSVSFLRHSTRTARPATLVLWAAPARPVQQVFLAPCRLHLAHVARVLITTLVSVRHVHAPRWCDCLYFVSGQRQFAAGKHRVHRLLLQRGLHGRQRRRLLRLPRRRLQGHLRCRARVLMFLARDQSVRQSPKSLLACSHVPRYHNSSGCWMCARGILCIKVFTYVVCIDARTTYARLFPVYGCVHCRHGHVTIRISFKDYTTPNTFLRKYV